MIQSCYLNPVFNNKCFKLIINTAEKYCHDIVREYGENNYIDGNVGLVGMGLSGAMIVPALAVQMDWPFAIVRKANESTHSYLSVEGEFSFNQYIFVDDFVSEGNTFATVNYKMNLSRSSVPIGAVFYRGDNYVKGNHYKNQMIYTVKNSYREQIAWELKISSLAEQLDKMIVKRFLISGETDLVAVDIKDGGDRECQSY